LRALSSLKAGTFCATIFIFWPVWVEVIERYLLSRTRGSIGGSVLTHHDRLLQANHVRLGIVDLRGQTNRPLREVPLVVAVVDGCRGVEESGEGACGGHPVQLCVDTMVDVPGHDGDIRILV